MLSEPAVPPSISQPADVLTPETRSIECQNNVEASNSKRCLSLCSGHGGYGDVGILSLAGFTISRERQSAISRGFNAGPIKRPEDGEKDRDGIVQIDWWRQLRVGSAARVLAGPTP